MILCNGLVVKHCLLTLEVLCGWPTWAMGILTRWVKCATSAECKIGISAVLMDTCDMNPQMIRNGLARQKMVSHDGGCYLSLMEVATLA
jgi:hypothetical protein